MDFSSKRATVLAVIFFTVLSFATGNEGTESKEATDSSGPDLKNQTSSQVNGSVFDYSESLEDQDDYLDDSSSKNSTIYNPEDIKLDETLKDATTPSPTASVLVNSTKSLGAVVTNTTENEPTPAMPSSVGEPEVTTSELLVTSSTTEEIGSSDSPSPSTTTNKDDSTDTTLTLSTEDGNITSSEKVPASSIVTQDAENEGHTVIYSDLDHVKHAGVKTWAVVLVSVLISFAVVFTLLYFIRGELIRRRKADQRRLLRGSVSSEGYFYGDGAEGNTSGKFEL